MASGSGCTLAPTSLPGSNGPVRASSPARAGPSPFSTGLGEAFGQLEEALDARLLVVELVGQGASVRGGALGEVLEAALGVVGQRIDVHDVLLGAGDAERRAALGEG